jgi:hypothetical protein
MMFVHLAITLAWYLTPRWAYALSDRKDQGILGLGGLGTRGVGH